jgi:hypothetical protein
MKTINVFYYSLLLTIIALSCSTKKENVSELNDSSTLEINYDTLSPDTTDSFIPAIGTFTFDGGPLPDESGYLYQKLTIRQDKDSIQGELVSAIYLARSQAGGYIMPDTLVYTKFFGEDWKTEVHLYPIDMEGTLIVQGKNVNNQFMNIFDEGPDGGIYFFLEKEGKNLKANNDALFERMN